MSDEPNTQQQAEFLWTLPTRGDGRRGPRGGHPRGGWEPPASPWPDWITDLRGSDHTPFDHLSQIAVAAEHARFSGIVAPYDPQGEESWVVATALARETRWLTLIPEIALGSTTAVYAAKMSATFQRITGGRMGWRLTPGQQLTTARSGLDPQADAEWFEQAAEFLTVARGVWYERPFSHDGRWYQVENGGFPPPLADSPFPRVYTSGSQPDALELAASHADVHLLPYAGAESLASAISTLQRRSAEAGRSVRPGLVLPIIAREEPEEAWERVHRLWLSNAPGSSVNARADVEALSVEPTVWSGFGALGFDTSHGLVGSYEQVAETLRGLIDTGVGTFAVSGYPQIEETYRLGEHLLHLVNRPDIPAARAQSALAR